MGKECHPTLSAAEVKDAWKYTKLRRMRDQTISDWLCITAAEADILEGLPPATQYRPANDPPPDPMPRDIQRGVIARRRAEITALIENLGHIPTVRKMADLLKAKGFEGNHQTVFKDYKALGIESGRTRKARAEREEAQTHLSLSCMRESVDKNDDDQAA